MSTKKQNAVVVGRRLRRFLGALLALGFGSAWWSLVPPVKAAEAAPAHVTKHVAPRTPVVAVTHVPTIRLPYVPRPVEPHRPRPHVVHTPVVVVVDPVDVKPIIDPIDVKPIDVTPVITPVVEPVIDPVPVPVPEDDPIPHIRTRSS